jgi:hypothetical protein
MFESSQKVADLYARDILHRFNYTLDDIAKAMLGLGSSEVTGTVISVTRNLSAAQLAEIGECGKAYGDPTGTAIYEVNLGDSIDPKDSGRFILLALARRTIVARMYDIRKQEEQVGGRQTLSRIGR